MNRVSGYILLSQLNKSKTYIPKTDIKTEIMAKVLLEGLKISYRLGRNLFSKYVEEPRRDLKLLTFQNEMIIRNQNEHLRNQSELLKIMKKTI